MVIELGHYCLILALALALAQSALPFWGALRGDTRLMAVAGPAALGQFLFVGLAFAALIHAYVTSDFSVLNVVENSHSAKPLVYKISGTWGNHEGSMLLWVLILVLFGALLAAFGTNLPDRLRALVLSVQAWIAVVFLLFVLFTSNPFARVFPAPLEGNDLNPLLQDIGLAIHPPLLYLGYVGCSVSFAFAIAALISGRIDAAWARWVRPWTLAAWVFLTLGIAMGSYWAYYELGWGGFWFWDPVENASFMPWLAATALLHSAAVMEKRDALKIWTVLLAILAFSLSLIGTFLVRSGVLTSVHAFASDPTRGVFILAILCLFIGGALTLFAWRASTLTQGGIFAPISREGALIFNNLILVTACASVLVGTLYPLVYQAATGGRISVGAPWFNLIFAFFILPLFLALPFGPLLAWKRGDILAAAERLWAAFAVTLGAVILTAFLAGVGEIGALVGIGLAVWVIAGAVSEFATRIRLGVIPVGDSIRRAVGLPRSAFGACLGHLGIGLTFLGIVVAGTWQTETTLDMRPGQTVEIAGRTVSFQAAGSRAGPNYRETVAEFRVLDGGTLVRLMAPAKRLYPARGTETTEAAIATFGVSQLYISLGGIEADTATVRIYWKPFVALIWLGALVMAAGGVLSLSDRRLRVGAPRPARRALEPAE